MANTPSWAWCRLYNETPEDKKMARIARVVNVQRVVVLGVWTGLLAIANGSPVRGSLMLTEDMPYLPDELADMIGIDLAQFNSIVKAMLDIGMVLWDEDCLVIDKFTTRNPESDSSTERVRRFRARKAADEEPGSAEEGETKAGQDVTDVKRYGNVTVTSPEKETESEKEKEGETERIAAAAEKCPLQEAFVQEAKIQPLKKPKNDWQMVFDELAAAGAEVVDVREGVRWLCENGKHPTHPKAIVGSVMTAMRKRKTTQKPAKVPDRNRYLSGEFAEFIQH
jgi:hypothetical protein